MLFIYINKYKINIIFIIFSFMIENLKWKYIFKAFSLIEVLFVIVLIAIISIIAFLNFWSQSPKARNAMREDSSSKVRLSYLSKITQEQFNHSTCEEVWALPVTYSWSSQIGCNVKLNWSASWKLFLDSIGIIWSIKDPDSTNSDYEFTYLKGTSMHEFAYVKENTSSSLLNTMKAYALDFVDANWKYIYIDWNYISNYLSQIFCLTPIKIINRPDFNSVVTFSSTGIIVNQTDSTVLWSYANYLANIINLNVSTSNNADIQIAAWNKASIFLSKDWTIKSVWNNDSWQLWLWNTTSTSSLMSVPYLWSVNKIYSWPNRDYFMYLMNDWTVKAVGQNTYPWLPQYSWELWIWNTINQSTPITIPWLSNVTQIAIWAFHTLFLLSDWTVKSVGYNWEGELGIWNTTSQLTPILIPWLTGVIWVAAASRSSYFLMNDWTVKSVGQNNYWQLWNWNTTDQSSIQTISWLSNVKQIEGRSLNVAFLLNDWTVKVLGKNNFWQLWIWNTTNQTSIQTIPWLSNVSQISSGMFHTLFLLNDWTVKAVGINTNWQLWNWNTTNQSSLVTVSWVSNVKQVKAWWSYDLILLTDWTVKVLWDDTYWELWLTNTNGLWNRFNIITATTIPWLSLK